ncbi:MAG: hypothetical protein NVS9B3_03700 [Gemmatimonadaceae bacterium]
MRTVHHLALALVGATGVAACHGSDKGTGPAAATVTLDSIVPKTGTIGTQLAVYGSGFQAGAKVAVGALPSPTVQLVAPTLFATTPDGLLKDSTYAIKVTNPDGGWASLAAAFKVVAPTIARVNGATRPSGLIGMTVLIEGTALGDAKHGKVFFLGTAGAPIQAAIVDSVNDWTNSFIVTTVPQGTVSPSAVYVQTATGTTSQIPFTLIATSGFSPSAITWARAADLPAKLQGLGALFVPVVTGSGTTLTQTNYVYVVGGAADVTNVATPSVMQATIPASGGITAWALSTNQLPAARAYHAYATATSSNAPVDSLTGGFLYVLGGVDALGKTVNTVYVSKLDLTGAVGPWTTTTPLPAAVHSGSATVFRGFVYLTGGADSLNATTPLAYRAAIKSDGTLGSWTPTAPMPTKSAFHVITNFGPYLYVVGGDSGAVATVTASQSGTELGSVNLARINLRTGDLAAGWLSQPALGKARSKHGLLATQGALFVTSGIYSGLPGSSENTYATIAGDGTLAGSWNGATGSNTIGGLLGYSLYNQAAVTYVDAAGKGHVLVLGGANRASQGSASAAVVYY